MFSVSGKTISVATFEIAVSLFLSVTAHLNLYPSLSFVTSTVSVSVLYPFKPESVQLFPQSLLTCHWYLSSVSAIVTLIFTVFPALVVISTGCEVIVIVNAIVRVAASDVILLPYLSVTIHLNLYPSLSSIASTESLSVLLPLILESTHVSPPSLLVCH